MPGLRDYPPDEAAQRQQANWRAFRRMLVSLFWLATLPALLAIWGAGYGYALLTVSRQDCPPEIISKESNR